MRLHILLISGLFLSACSSRDAAKPESSAATGPTVIAVTPADSTAGARPALPACPHTGKWALCSIERRLKQSGFVVKLVEGDAPKRAGFSVKPKVYTLGQARLEIFLYESEADVAHDVAKLDTVIVAPKGTTPAWDGQPIFMRSGNLAAVLLTQNARQAERVVLAITAGAPQPGSPR